MNRLPDQAVHTGMTTPLRVMISAPDFVVLHQRLIRTGAIRRGPSPSDLITFDLDGLTYSATKLAARRARAGAREPVILTLVEMNASSSPAVPGLAKSAT